MTVPAAPSAAGLATTLSPALSRLARVIRNQWRSSPVTLTQLTLMSALERLGAVSVGELAAAERLPHPTLSRLLDDLEAQGMVRRGPHPDDRRRSVVEIAPGGTRFLAEERSRPEDFLAERLAALVADERALLQQAIPVLEQLAKRADQVRRVPR
jgi:DNA-binding MarR family transcriptional regulator